jgi:CheY-like chemotaxis protein
MAERIVLCVDDEALILLSLRHSLSRALGAAYRCETALSGDSALSCLDALSLEGRELAAVVSDWRMPGMGGDEFLRRVRERNPTLPLIVLTGYAEREQLQSLDAELSLSATLQKPCNVALLAELIRKLSYGACE